MAIRARRHPRRFQRKFYAKKATSCQYRRLAKTAATLSWGRRRYFAILYRVRNSQHLRSNTFMKSRLRGSWTMTTGWLSLRFRSLFPETPRRESLALTAKYTVLCQARKGSRPFYIQCVYFLRADI